MPCADLRWVNLVPVFLADGQVCFSYNSSSSTTQLHLETAWYVTVFMSRTCSSSLLTLGLFSICSLKGGSTVNTISKCFSPHAAISVVSFPLRQSASCWSQMGSAHIAGGRCATLLYVLGEVASGRRLQRTWGATFPKGHQTVGFFFKKRFALFEWKIKLLVQWPNEQTIRGYLHLHACAYIQPFSCSWNPPASLSPLLTIATHPCCPPPWTVFIISSYHQLISQLVPFHPSETNSFSIWCLTCVTPRAAFCQFVRWCKCLRVCYAAINCKLFFFSSVFSVCDTFAWAGLPKSLLYHCLSWFGSSCFSVVPWQAATTFAYLSKAFPLCGGRDWVLGKGEADVLELWI